MSEFKFSCPQCAQPLQGDESFGGKQITCPACQHLMRIPASPAPLAAGNNSAASGRPRNSFVNRSSPFKPKPPAPLFQPVAQPLGTVASPAAVSVRQRIAAWFTRHHAD